MFMRLLALGLFVVALYLVPELRCFLLHPVSSFVSACGDAFNYVQKHLGRLCPTGDLDVYCGYFGYGKTLSAVHRVVGIYRRFDGLTVWDSRQKRFVRQRVLVLSNVTLSIPFVPLTGLQQVVSASRVNQSYDDENGTYTVTIVLMDELSVQMNSRDFKSNFNAYFLNTLLCCRHYHISFYGTAQRFQHCDKLLRDVTRNVIQCRKRWRFQVLRYYDAWEMENAQNPELIKPLSVRCWFVRNRDYDAYDTLAVVGNLEKSFSSGDMLTESEILNNQSSSPLPGIDAVSNPSFGLKRRWKNLRK